MWLMRYRTLGFAVSVAASLSCGAAGTMDLYLLIGQSNMAGRGVLTDSNRVSADRIFKFDADMRWQRAEEPIHFDKPDIAGAGLAASFARAMADRCEGVTIGLIPCAVGGTRIERWVEGGDLWSNAVARARIAMRSGTLRGILWHQGEGDCSAELAPLWGAKLEGMIASFRRELGHVPFIAGELGRYLENSYHEDINAHLHALEGSVSDYGVASSEGLTCKSDNVHFDTVALREFGLRYAAAMVSCMGNGSEPAPTNLAWVCESAITSGRTGSWSGDVAYDARGKAHLDGDSVFTPDTASNGRKVELTVTLEMSEYAAEGADPDAEAQCAIRLGTNGCFQVWVGGGTAHWTDVVAEGVTPQSGRVYTFRIAFDYWAQNYSVDVLQGVEWVQLAAPFGAATFPITARTKRVSSISFSGDTFFETLLGDYAGRLSSGLLIGIR